MTNYLKERLDNADHLLEQMKQADRNGTGLLPAKRITAGENRGEKEALVLIKALPSTMREKVSSNIDVVDDEKTQDRKVNQNIATVVNQEDGPDLAERPKSGEALLNVEGGQTFSRWIGGILKREDERESGVSPSKEGGEDRRSSALAAALEQMDWAGSAWAGGMILEKRRGDFPALPIGARIQRPPDPLGGSEAGWDSPRGAAVAQGGAGGDRQWVEQADRAFRRDSRRYDGGFYLY